MACALVEEAVKDADVIVTVTSSSKPVVMAQWVKPGAHLNGRPSGSCIHMIFNWHGQFYIMEQKN